MKKKIFNAFLLGVCGSTFENCFATRESRMFLPITLDRVTASSGRMLALFSSETVAAEIKQDLERFETFDLFQKAEVQKKIFKTLWKPSFDASEDPVISSIRLSKEIALDSGLASMRFYREAMVASDARAILPLLELLNEFTFCNHPRVREEIAVHEDFQINFLVQKAAERCSFEAILQSLIAGQRQVTQKCLISVFQRKLKNQPPSTSVLIELLERIKNCCLEESIERVAPPLALISGEEEEEIVPASESVEARRDDLPSEESYGGGWNVPASESVEARRDDLPSEESYGGGWNVPASESVEARRDDLPSEESDDGGWNDDEVWNSSDESERAKEEKAQLRKEFEELYKECL
jgi:hypothetical protein